MAMMDRYGDMDQKAAKTSETRPVFKKIQKKKNRVLILFQAIIVAHLLMVTSLL